MEGLLIVQISAGIHVAAHIDVLDAGKCRARLGIGAEGVYLHHDGLGPVTDDEAFQVVAVGELLTDGLVPSGKDFDFFKLCTSVEHTAAHAGHSGGQGADLQGRATLEGVAGDSHASGG